MNLYGP